MTRHAADDGVSRFLCSPRFGARAAGRARCVMLPGVATTLGVDRMAKGLDKKKETKKKPAKTMKEKRAEKSEKKATRGFAPT